MESIAEDGLWINALRPTALTQLLALENLVVTALELVPRQARLYRHCTPTSSVAVCPACHAASFQIHQYHRRTVRDLPWGPWACYLQLMRRRFWCARCARPFTEACPAVAPCARTTRRFAAALVAAVAATTIDAAAAACAHGYHAVEGIFYRTAQAAHPPHPPAHRVRRLGIDEIAARKGHGHYKLVLVDLDRWVVIEQLPDRRKETLSAYLLTWSAKARAAVDQIPVVALVPAGIAVVPVGTAKRAPLRAIWARRLAWSAFWPSSSTRPPSPKTAKLNGWAASVARNSGVC